MLEVQRYLSENPLERLTEEYGIVATRHETEPLVILNYCQIDSHKFKTHPIVRECRGLTLQLNTWRIVARSFNRFYNIGEHPEEQSKFNWQDFVCQEKLDGSLLILYYYDDKFWLNTRGSFGQGNINQSGHTWQTLFAPLILANGESRIPVRCTCVFEGMSLYNQVVRRYAQPQVSLLTVFNNNGEELSHNHVDIIADVNGWSRPAVHKFTSQEEVTTWLEAHEDPTFEGFVVRDNTNIRIKIKKSSYLALHRTVNNQNVWMPKNLIPLILSNEIDEVLVYFPDMKPQVDAARAKLDAAYLEAKAAFDEATPLTSQKDKAILIQKRTKLTSPCFTAWKNKESFDAVWVRSADMLVKHLFE